ncbi:MAG: PRC-barrel domain-containing protein [Verrucomicrobiales bacterium]
MKQKAIAVLAITGLATLGWAQDTTSPDAPRADQAARGDTEGTEEQFVAYDGMIDSAELGAATVYNKQDEDLGNIDRLVLNADGQVEFAVVSVGGFLGIGDRLVAVPWSSFEIMEEVDDSERTVSTAATDTEVQVEPGEDDAAARDEAREKGDAAEAPELRVVLDANKERLEQAPKFDPDKPNQLGSRDASEEVSDYWRKDSAGAPRSTETETDTTTTAPSSSN